MRRSCLECVVKHLGDAAVYIEECAMGYPNYFGYVYGHLDHAASECLEVYPELALTIREHRIKWAEYRKDKMHVIPFEALFNFIDAMEESDRELEVPAEVFAGLTLGSDGRPVFSMDTRPESVKGDEDGNGKLLKEKNAAKPLKVAVSPFSDVPQNNVSHDRDVEE